MLSLLAFACGRTARNDLVDEPPDFAGSGGVDSHVGVPGDGSGGITEVAAAGAGAAPSGGSKDGSGGMVASDAGAGGENSPELSGVQLDGSPIYTRVQRLTNRQWGHAVSDILRLTEGHELEDRLAAPVLGVTTFDNNEKVLFVDQTNAGDFESAAEAAAAIATGSADALARLSAGEDAESFVRTFGRRAFRRPLAAEEEAKYQAVFARGEELYGAGFANGAALVIRAMLQSPHFLYRTELGAAGAPLTGYELAAKLSFWLLETTPSDSLLDAAGGGQLDSDNGLEAAARDMLEDPRSLAVMRDFHGQLLNIRRYDGLVKTGVQDFQSMTTELTLASQAFFDRLYSQEFGLRELLTSQHAYVGPELAPFYGVAAPPELELRDVGAARSGYFMQVPFLMVTGNDAQSDPIRRGLDLQRMLCGALPPPPANVPTPLEPRDGETTRERFTRYTEGCGNCHAVYIDPLGFSLENFDGLGSQRNIDRGQPVDTTGSYPFAEGVKSFADGNELMKIMADSVQVHTCYSKNVTSYALGRDLVERDRSALEALAQVSLTQSLKELVIALVRDPAFRVREEGLP